jgi:hypothetical protein
MDRRCGIAPDGTRVKRAKDPTSVVQPVVTEQAATQEPETGTSATSGYVFLHMKN